VFAGNKGIGRFSCDRLGTRLELFSRPVGGQRVEYLEVNWENFEADAKREFESIDTKLTFTGSFPAPNKIKPPSKNGTILRISGLRD